LVSGFELDGSQVYILESVVNGAQGSVLGQYGVDANTFLQTVAATLATQQ
jgi:hypothetical protein